MELFRSAGKDLLTRIFTHLIFLFHPFSFFFPSYSMPLLPFSSSSSLFPSLSSHVLLSLFPFSFPPFPISLPPPYPLHFLLFTFPFFLFFSSLFPILNPISPFYPHFSLSIKSTMYCLCSLFCTWHSSSFTSSNPTFSLPPPFSDPKARFTRAKFPYVAAQS